jgi:hypothetical protein
MHIMVGNNDQEELATAIVVSLIPQAIKPGLHCALTPQSYPDFAATSTTKWISTESAAHCLLFC